MNGIKEYALTISDSKRSQTFFYENDQQIWPCRCGIVHRGAYAQEDWAMHECLHQVDLIVDKLPDDNYQVLCPDCGASWKGGK